MIMMGLEENGEGMLTISESARNRVRESTQPVHPSSHIADYGIRTKALSGSKSGTVDIEIRTLGSKALEVTSSAVKRLAETPSRKNGISVDRCAAALEVPCNTEITFIETFWLGPYQGLTQPASLGGEGRGGVSVALPCHCSTELLPSA